MDKNIRKVKIPTTGKQTQITSKVKKIANTIIGKDLITITRNIAQKIRQMEAIDASKGPDFSKTAEQILEKNSIKGCNEAGVLFSTLLRAKGIQNTYIQALDKIAVAAYDPKKPKLKGHVFLEVRIPNEDKKNVIINSTTGEVSNKLPQNMLIGKRGLDAWDMG